MWKRRNFLVAGAALMGSGVHGPGAQTLGGGGSRVVIAVDQKAAFSYLPLSIAEQKGYFAEEGLSVLVREFREPGAALKALQTGAAQVLSGPFGHTFDQQLKEQAHTAFVLQGRTPQLVLGVSHKAVPRFSGLQDLRGRRIGVTGMDSASHRVTNLLLNRVGLGVTNEVQYLGMSSPTEAVTRFHSGDIDAICFDEPVITLLEQSGALRVVADTRTVRGCTEVFGGPLPAGCLMAPATYVREQQQVCQALANAMVHALKWLQTAGPSDIIKTVPESFFMGDRALYLAAFSRAREAWAPDGLMPTSGPRIALDVWRGARSTQTADRINLAETFTNDFARKAKARFKA